MIRLIVAGFLLLAALGSGAQAATTQGAVPGDLTSQCAANVPLEGNGAAAVVICGPITLPATVTSGGLMYGSATGVISSSGAYTANAFLTGGGAGAAPVGVAITGLVLGNGASAPSAYTGSTCTNQFVSAISAAGVATCNSVTNTYLTAGTFSSITGTGTLTAGATGAGFTVALAISTITGALPCANFPALTGDVTATAAACVTVLTNIPTGTPAVGTILFTNIAAPSSPASGKVSVYSDSTDLRFHDKNASGTIGTTVVADTGASNNYISAISSTGVITKSRPTCSTLSDSAALCSSTDAANLTGTVATGRISGSYTGITGVGTLTAGATGVGFTVALTTSTVTGLLTTTNGGTGANNTPTSGNYLKGNGSSFVTSSGAASGTGACSAGNFVSTLNSDAAPTCTTPTGSGTVNSGTAGQLAYYATSTTAVSGNANFTVSGGAFTVGIGGSVQGTVLIAGVTSGALTLAVPATVTGTITFPSGTTNFSSTGGTSQVVKQTSSGGAFTVAQLAASDLSNGTTGSGSVVLATAPTIATSLTTPILIGGTGTTSTVTIQPTSGAGTTGADIIFATGTNGGSERMRIINAGAVGIGTATPAFNGFTSSTLTISGTSARGVLELRNSSTGTGGAAGDISWFNGSTELARIEVLAGGATNSGDLYFYTNNAGSLANTFTIDHTGNLFAPLLVQTSAAQSGTVCRGTAGLLTYDATLGCLASSARFKENIKEVSATDALAMVVKMRPVSFNKKQSDGGDKDPSEQFGFIAEDVAAVDGRLVAMEQDGNVRGVRYQQNSALFAGAITALKAENDRLRIQIEKLEHRN